MSFGVDVQYALSTDYRKKIWRPMMSAMKEYALVKNGDRIAVCISGGKDSMLLAKCMQEYKRHSPLDFELCFLCMDPGYTPENRAQIERNAELLEIPLTVFETDVFDAVEMMGGAPCHMCAKMRRGYLYRHAQALGCNKIALGHHYNDVIETLMMSLLYAGQVRCMRPRLRSDNVDGMELIRPLFKVHEEEILKWRDDNGLTFLNCACKMTRDNGIRTDGTSDSKRQEMKALIKRLDSMNPDAGRNLFRSVHNVDLDSLIEWKHMGKRYSFLEEDED